MMRLMEEYRKMNEEQLRKKIKGFENRMMTAVEKAVQQKERPQNRSRLRREIAKINTILNERK